MDFACTGCGRTWTSNSRSNRAQECKTCGTLVLPNDVDESSDQGSGEAQQASYPKNKRLFGEFRCPQCKRSWKSANSWVDASQKCKPCGIDVWPHKLRPLLRNGPTVVDNRKPHPQELCQKCRELGFYCRELDGQYSYTVDNDDDVDFLTGILGATNIY